jgi:DNA-directed RNA polymerase sigma subunit (sigma70/sigma32)
LILADLTNLELGERFGLLLAVEVAPERSSEFVHYVSIARAHRQALEAARRALMDDDVWLVAFARAVGPGALPPEKIVEAGNLGLRLAIGRYNPHRGVRFSTCATWWIRRTIRRALLRFRHGARPVPPVLAAWQILHTRREFTALHGRPPVDDELVGLTGLPLAAIRRADGGGATRRGS